MCRYKVTRTLKVDFVFFLDQYSKKTSWLLENSDKSMIERNFTFA